MQLQEPGRTETIPASRSGGSESVQRVLGFARRQLRMDVAWLSRFAGDEQIFEQVSTDRRGLSPMKGSSSTLAGSYCMRVLDGRLRSVIPDARQDLVTRELAITRELDIGAYLGVPVLLSDGEPYGMLCCISHRPITDDGSDRLPATLRLLAQMLGEIVDRSRTTAAATRAELRARVVGAITGDGRRVVSQPIVDIAAGVALGVEALTRFDEPPTPDVWFTDAAAVGLAVELELACASTALDLLAGDSLPGLLAVNLSPATILSPLCTLLLQRSDRRRLIIEVTEHAQVDDYDALNAALAPHRKAGARLAIDDAGAGYASFRHILQLSPDFIKVDIGLVRQIDSDPVKRSLITALGTVASTAGARLIAEGVETQGELDTLHALGVTLAQGYFLCRPSEAPQLDGFPRPGRTAQAATRP